MSVEHMTRSTIERLRMELLVAAALGLVFVFSTSSNIPTGDRALPFWIGVAILIVMMFATAFLSWNQFFTMENE